MRKRKKDLKSGISISVNVNVEKIVGYMCVAGILIVGIIFITKEINHKLLTEKRN